MLYGAEFALFSEIHTKHINTVWAECKILNVKTVGELPNQQASKGHTINYLFHSFKWKLSFIAQFSLL
jgi:hypothetical protein